MTRHRIQLGPVDVVIGVACLLIAYVAFGQAITDYRYQVAGLADPFLGRPAPAVTIVIGLLLTAGGVGLLFGVPAYHRRLSGPAPLEAAGGAPLRWGWLLVAGWVAYAIGAGTVLGGSGSPTLGGTVHAEFGTPLDSTADVPVACRLVAGEPQVVAIITPEAQGMPVLDLRSPATGAALTWAGPVPAIATLPYASRPPFEPPNVPEREAPYRQFPVYGGTVTEEPPIGFLEAYEYRVLELAESGLSGTARLEGTRFKDPYGGGDLKWMNLEVPNDPWPPTIDLTMAWACGTPE
jgi:hypothetical protein